MLKTETKQKKNNMSREEKRANAQKLKGMFKNLTPVDEFLRQKYSEVPY